MKIANTEVAGLAGGLYELFENLGLELFSGLIGPVRARRRELEYKRVTAGAILAGGILGFVAGLLVFGLPALASGPPHISLGCAIFEILILVPLFGGLLFWLLASSIIGYIKRLRAEDVNSASVPAFGASFDIVFAEAQKRYLDAGYPPKEADREAWWFAALRTGLSAIVKANSR